MMDLLVLAFGGTQNGGCERLGGTPDLRGIMNRFCGWQTIVPDRHTKHLPCYFDCSASRCPCFDVGVISLPCAREGVASSLSAGYGIATHVRWLSVALFHAFVMRHA